MTFEEEIKQSLKDLTGYERCQFSWLCALRALPFLSVERGFTYWEEKERQKHLYSIFYAMDVNAQAAFTNDFTRVDILRAAVKAAAITTAHIGVEGAVVYAACATVYAAKATAAAYAAADIASYANADPNTVANTVAAACAYADRKIVDKIIAADNAKADDNTISAATAAVFAAKAANVAFDLESILVKDIEAIKKNKLNECNLDTSVYGKIWDNFQDDLKAVGCAYWARYYDDLFKNGFAINPNSLTSP